METESVQASDSVPYERMGTLGSCPVPHEHRGLMLFYVFCVQHAFLMLKH